MNRGGTPAMWKQLRTLVRQWQSLWRDRNLYRVSGKREPFVAVLQEKYGYTHVAAEEEFDRRIAQFKAAQQKPNKNRIR